MPEVEKNSVFSVEEVQAFIRSDPDIAAGIFEDIEEQVIGQGPLIFVPMPEEEKGIPVIAGKAVRTGDPDESPSILEEAMDEGIGLALESFRHQPVEVDALEIPAVERRRQKKS